MGALCHGRQVDPLFVAQGHFIVLLRYMVAAIEFSKIFLWLFVNKQNEGTSIGADLLQVVM